MYPDEASCHCAACEDMGFERGLACPGDGRCQVGRCGQAGHVTYPHSFTRACACRATNPVLARERDFLRRRARRAEGER
jgi:hypothetical protein